MSESAAVTQTKPLSAGGKEYAAPPMSYELRAKFSAWLENNAFAGVRRQRPLLPPDLYAEELAVVQRDVAAQVYREESATWVKALNQPAGAKEALRLLLAKGDPALDATPELVDGLFAADAAACWQTLDWAVTGPFAPTPAPA